MSELKGTDIALEADTGNDIVFENQNGEIARVGDDGILNTQASPTVIENSSVDTLVTKGYSAQTEHTHTNKTVLDNTTASYTTTEESKLTGIEAGATADQTQADINALNVNADKLNSTYQAHLAASTLLGTSNSLMPSQNAVKVYNDSKATSHQSSNHSIGKPVFWVVKNANQWCAQNAEVTLTWNSVYNDQTSDWDSINHRFYCPVTGYYRIILNISWASHLYYANDRIDARIRKSATVVGQTLMEFPVQGTYFTSQTVFWVGYASSGEYFDARAKIASSYSGNNIDGASGNMWSTFMGHHVAYKA